MNERIKELARQAREYASVMHTKSHIVLTVMQDTFEERFVELIVKESVKALWTEDCHVSDLAIINFNEKKRKIFKHMGITE